MIQQNLTYYSLTFFLLSLFHIPMHAEDTCKCEEIRIIDSADMQSALTKKPLVFSDKIDVLLGGAKGALIGALIGCSLGHGINYCFNTKSTHLLLGIPTSIIGGMLGCTIHALSLFSISYNALIGKIQLILSTPLIVNESTEESFLEHINRHFLSSSWPLVEAFEKINNIHSDMQKYKQTLEQFQLNIENDKDRKNLLKITDACLAILEKKIIILKNQPLFYQQNQSKLQAEMIRQQQIANSSRYGYRY